MTNNKKKLYFKIALRLTHILIVGLLVACNFNAKFAKDDDLCALFPDATSCGGGVEKMPETEAEIIAASSYMRIEASAGGTSEYTTGTMTADDTITLHAAAYNSSNVFLGNVTVTWAIQNAKGVVAVGPSKSTTFDANVTGTEIVDMSVSTFNDSTGNITINPGVQASIKINDNSGSVGVELNTNTLNADQTDTLYSSSYDGDGNWIADVASDWTFVNDKGSFNASVNSVSAAASVTFNADVTTSAADHSVMRASFGGHTDDTGDVNSGFQITAGAQANIKINGAAGSGGTELNTYSMNADQTVGLYSSSYDTDGNWIANVASDWTFVNDKGSFNASVNSVSAASSVTFNAENATSAADHGVVRASFGGDTDDTGTAIAGIEVSVGVQAAVKITDATGSGGAEIDTHTMTADQTKNLWAASYDADDNFISNVSADWTFTNDKGSFNASVVNSVSGATNVTFNGDVTTSAADHGVIHISFGGDTDDTGDVNAGFEVSVGAQASIKINDAAGSGGSELDTNTLTADQTDLLYASSYDGDSNWIADVAADWTFINDKGSFNASVNSVSAATSVTFNADVTTSAADHAVIRASFGGDTDDTGTTVAGIEINVGAQASIKINDAAGSGGSELDTNTLTADQTDLLYASSYDADSNWIADVAADWTFVNDKGSFNASVNSVSAATSVTFNAEVTTSAADHAVIRASFGGDTDDTGTTVAGIEINVGAQASIKINDAAGAGGSELDTNTLTADQTDLLYASSYDADSNWIADVAADWIFVNDKGSFNASVNSVSAATSVTFNADVTTSAADHAVIRASFGGHTDDTGTTVAGIEINVGAQASIKINDAAGSGGSELDTNTLTTDQTDLLYASSYDGDSNWIADVAADWTFVNDKGSFNASVNSVSAATSVTFNADVTTSAADHAVIRASFGGDTDDTGTTVAGIEINVGAQASIQINDAAGSGGSELDTNTLTTDQTDLLYASSYDADSNWIADVAADWTFVNDKGTFNASVNSVSAATSVTFNADVTTSAADHAVIRASFGGDTDDTGTAVAGIEINVGAQASIKINDAAGSGGSELDTNTLTADQTDLLYASSYDGDSNWIANVAADWTFVNDKGSFNASVNSVSAATSVTFNADVTTVVADHAVIRASFGGDTDDTGTTIAGIEISAGAQATVRINDVSGSGGVAKETNNMTADDSITLHGAAYDSDGNYISNPSGTWTFTNDKGSFLPGSDDNSETGASVTFYANQATIAADHCVINFSSGGDNDDTGTVNAGFEITAGALVNIRVESKSDGSGNVFTTGEYFNDVTSGTTMTLFSVGYDADSNYKGTESATWTFNSSGNQTSSNGVGTIVAGPAVSTTWTVLNVVGADAIIATAGAKSDDTGTMDVGYTAASGDALTNVTDFSIGYYRACAVINTDTVKCWGLALEPYGTSGYLGLEDDTVGSTLIPKTVQIDGGGGDLTNIEQVESVLYGSCAREKLASGGKVYCWGRSQQKGSSDAAKVIKIDAGTDLTNAVDIATGYWGSCAVLNDGTVRCWGSQDDHLGRNFPGSQTYAELVETSVGVSLTNVDKIVVDDRSACALINDGSVTCWGYGSSYRLGNNNVANVGYATAVVLDEAGGNFATSSIHGWGYETMRCGIKADKTVKCWGTGYMGNSTTINEKADFVWDGPSSNITDIVDLGVGDGFGCAVKEGNGTIHCWGNNSAYALGNNGTTNTFLYADQLVKGADGTTPLTKASDVEMGDKNGCALFPPSGILRCWGENDYGVVGNIRSGTEYRYAKNEVISVDSANPTWTDMTTVAEVKVGNNFACARTTGKKVMCWGQNNNCQIGNGEDCNKEYWQVPNDASGMAYVEKTGGVELTNVEEIDLGAWHGCARLTDGSAWCWGENGQGQLGDNTTSTKNYAVQVYKDAGVTYLDNVTALAVGTYTSCAVISDNTLKCWGYNGSNGLLANGGTTNRYYADVAKIDAGTTLTNVASASVADDLICVVLTDNTAACWGKVFEGVCGDNDAALTKYADTKVLTSIGVETTDIAKIAIGGDHVLALTTANTVRSWGEKYNNNRTGNATDNRPFADEMMESSTGVSFTDASDITGGPWHSCVLKSTDKKVYCVGRNNVLMLGDGSRTQRAWLDSPVVDSALADVTDFTQIDSGANFPTCGVTTGGKVRCWGYGAYGIHVNGSRTEFGSGYTSEIVQRIAP